MIEKFDAKNKWANISYAHDFIDRVFLHAARIVSGDCFEYRSKPGTRNLDYVQTYEGRRWFEQTHRRHALHPAVLDMMRLYRPDDWQQLLLEWPHRALTDANRLAYNRDERSAMHNNDCDIKAVVTTIGKYLRRHFSYAPDDLIRDIVAEYTYGGGIEIVSSTEAMVNAVLNGPSSCMTHRFDILCADGERRHPYAVYDPSLGWSMAVRRDGDEILGRCLLWHDKDTGEKLFVRSYKRERDARQHSGADEAIEAWLKNQGYEKHSYWPDGVPIKEYELRSDGWLMPYIDGGTQKVDSCNFTICDGGDIEADGTSGTAGIKRATCSHCGSYYNDEDEGGSVGYHEDEHVCQSCLDDEYTCVLGHRGNQYYVPNDEVVEADGDYYHNGYLSDNNIVELHDGNYTHIDNAVYIESVDAYYDSDDNDICYAEDTGAYELVEDCWQCTESRNWYTDNEDSVEIDGELYHPDHAPETETNDTETN